LLAGLGLAEDEANLPIAGEVVQQFKSVAFAGGDYWFVVPEISVKRVNAMVRKAMAIAVGVLWNAPPENRRVIAGHDHNADAR
jgi:hypothetical protein